MTFFAAGAAGTATYIALGTAAVSAATSIYSSHQAGKASAAGASRASAAEGEAITKERLNATIRNSYATAVGQMQLALKKKQATQQGADITAAGLAAQGNARVATASTGSIGASTAAIVSDIGSKVQAAQDSVQDAYELSLDNYNRTLEEQTINTASGAPTPTQYQYDGPSAGQSIAAGLIQGAVSFASSYAVRKAQLGLGSQTPNVPSSAGDFSSFDTGYSKSGFLNTIRGVIN